MPGAPIRRRPEEGEREREERRGRREKEREEKRGRREKEREEGERRREEGGRRREGEGGGGRKGDESQLCHVFISAFFPSLLTILARSQTQSQKSFLHLPVGSFAPSR